MVARIRQQEDSMRVSRVAAIAVWLALGAVASTVENTLTVVVFDYARTPHEILMAAVKEGHRAFRSAGVETEWILCHPTQGCYVPEQFLPVKILPRPLPGKPISSNGMAFTLLCSIAEHCAASFVFYDRVLGFAEERSAPVDVTLGYVMAHEVGHLLGLGHRPGGIMSSAFNSQEMRRAAAGWLYFSPDDARQLRAVVARSQVARNTPRLIRLAGWPGDPAE
jgi:hypothetical protein